MIHSSTINPVLRQELQGFLMQYADNLTKDNPTVDLRELEAELKTVKGIGEKRLEEIMLIIEKHLGV